MRSEDKLTFALLHEVLSYNPETGELWWKVRRSNRQDMTKRAGSRNGHGYWQLSFQGCVFLQHRLIWFMEYGVWPTEIDHINRDKSDNRLCNLRDGSHRDNMMNTDIDYAELSQLGHAARWS